MNFFSGLAKTRLRMRAARLDEDALGDALIMADAGVRVSAEVVAELRKAAKAKWTPAERRAALAEILARRLRRLEAPLAVSDARPFVICVSGVNGGGKTTTIGKLAKRLTGSGLRTLLAAGDTFRAAAREQLQKWADRAGAEIILGGTGEGGGEKGKGGGGVGDPAAVAFDAISAGRARGADVVLIDTAGRLPTQANLMAEAAKIARAADKALPGAPHESLLVLDATTGQNALSQLRSFSAAVGITGTAVTKLDGSAKGGFLLAMAKEEHPVPVRFVGLGEGADDLAVFNAEEYAKALVGED